MRDGTASDKPTGPNDRAGGPAFPWQRFAVDGQWFPGMTLRDHFAAAALPGLVPLCFTDTRYSNETQATMFARRAYEVADAMLRERAK